MAVWTDVFCQERRKTASRPSRLVTKLKIFIKRFYEVCKGRSFFSCKNGALGLGPNRTRNDKIVLFAGARTPFIIREVQLPSQKNPIYRIIGEA